MKKGIALFLSFVFTASITSSFASAYTMDENESNSLSNPTTQFSENIQNTSNTVVVDCSTGWEPMSDEEWAEYIAFYSEAQPFGADPPSKNKLWDWSNGDYSATFSMKERVFTNYRFIGSTEYHVFAHLYNPNVEVDNALQVAIIDEKNAAKKIVSGNTTLDTVFNDLNVGTRYAFYVSKTQGDGFTGTGGITIYAPGT